MSRINFSDIKTRISADLLRLSKANVVVNQIITVSTFFQSDEWKEMKCTNLDNAHKLAIQFISAILGKGNFAIHDNGDALYDPSGFISKLSCSQISDLNNIDSNKLTGLFQSGDIYMLYIGTTMILPMSNPLKYI